MMSPGETRWRTSRGTRSSALRVLNQLKSHAIQLQPTITIARARRAHDHRDAAIAGVRTEARHA